ncbi:hypothetical protein diail_1676 [Diaporthe ilicicola]|nr:hypothetical protein diail_1676 [Diaporthe ilicicola]
MSRQSPVPRSHSSTSFYSTTTYHSFQDVELYEPGCTPDDQGMSTSRIPRSVETPVIRRQRTSRRDDFMSRMDDLDRNPASFQMVRQDSGYESSTPTRNSQTSKRHRDTSQTTSSPRTEAQPRNSMSQKRPALRRSRPISNMPRSSITVSRSPPRSNPQQQPQHNDPYSYFQFPSPEQLDEPEQQEQTQDLGQGADIAPVSLHLNTLNTNPQSEKPSTSSSSSAAAAAAAAASKQPEPTSCPGTESPLSPLPPQTTHYWTSDRTRRLEYAAIDAASRGVRGWVMRNCVPECFVPRERRRVCFDDDTGSVRRYRLDLIEIECPEDSVPPSPVGEKPRGFRARTTATTTGGGSSFRGRGLWAKLKSRTF